MLNHPLIDNRQPYAPFSFYINSFPNSFSLNHVFPYCLHYLLLCFLLPTHPEPFPVLPPWRRPLYSYQGHKILLMSMQVRCPCFNATLKGYTKGESNQQLCFVLRFPGKYNCSNLLIFLFTTSFVLCYL